MKKIFSIIFAFLLPTHLYAQHDPGRNATRLLAKNKIDDAINLLAKSPRKMNSPISEADRQFVLTMAACINKNSDIAFNHAKLAYEAGLPIERLQAGPRETLSPLYSNKSFNSWLKSRAKILLHGPLLGCVNDTSAKFWVRTSIEADVKIVAREMVDNVVRGDALSANNRTSIKNDFTTIVAISGLKPMTQYRYEVIINNQNTGKYSNFKTSHKKGSSGSFSVAFGGGAGFTPKNESMWSTISQRNPHALFLLGDNVYIDDPQETITQHYCYYRRQSQIEWRNLVSKCSVYTIYDDHDFGTNDCKPGPEIDKPSWKRPVWEIFRQNWNNPNYGGGYEQPGCWYDFHIGDVHFIMLDGRYYRDLAGGSMLGPIQKKWLFDTLESSPGKFKVLASPVPWSPGVKPGSNDTWDGFAAEREEIFSLIENKAINGVILMAADRHRSDLRKIKRPNGYDLYEVMSSRLTNMHTHPLVQKAKGSEWILGYNKKCSFGLMQFDTSGIDPQVEFSIINIDNQVVGSHTIKLDQLTSNKNK